MRNIVRIINNRRQRRCKRIKEINEAIQVDLLIITLCRVSVSRLSPSDRTRRIPVSTRVPSQFAVNLRHSIISRRKTELRLISWCRLHRSSSPPRSSRSLAVDGFWRDQDPAPTAGGSSCEVVGVLALEAALPVAESRDPLLANRR